VNDYKLDAATWRPRVTVRGRDLMGRGQHASGVDYPVSMVHIDGCVQSLYAVN